MRGAAALAALALVACDGDDAAPDAGVDQDLPVEPRFQPLADAIEAERVANGVAGVAALAFDDGQVVFARGFGTAGLGREAVTSTTAFRIGSVNKMMTAALLLRHVAAGELALDQPITDALPDFALMDEASAPSIEVGHLLSHQSGLYDYLELDAGAGFDDDGALDRYLTGDEGFETLAYLMAPAGRMYNYSNPNFYLAGLIAERLSGRPYREAMREHIFAPLGMAHTAFTAAELDGPVADGVSTDASGQPVAVAADAYDNPWGRPAGYAFSTVHDLHRFVRFLVDGDPAVLPDAERMGMQAAQVDTHEAGDLVHYGHGVQVLDGFFLPDGFRAVSLLSHGGDIPGYAASVAWVPSTGFGFITLASADGAHFDESLVLALETLAGLPGPEAGPDLSVDPADLPRFAGTYLDPFNAGTVEVALVDGALTVSMPDVDAAGIAYEPALIPLSPGNFVLRIQGTALPVTFLDDAAGEVEYLRTRAFVARRAAEPAPPRPIAAARFLRAIRQAAAPGPMIPPGRMTPR